MDPEGVEPPPNGFSQNLISGAVYSAVKLRILYNAILYGN